MASTIRTANFLDTAPAAALATGVTENQDYTVTRACFVADAHVIATATANVSGTAQLSRQALGSGGFTAISAALTMTTSGALIRAASIAVAQYVCAATDVLRVAFVDGGGTGGANGRFITELVNLPISGAA